MTAGCFYAVEGVDGCGKSGMVRQLVDHLRAHGPEGGAGGIATREPGGTPQGERIRALILSGSDDAWDPHAELLLMTAARIEHVRRVIRPTLAAGRFVVSDRYVGSTIAYQGAGRGMVDAFIRDLHARAVGGLMPDLTIVLDLDPAIGLARSRRRLAEGTVDEGRFETLDLDFHRRIRQSFLDQAGRDPAAHVVIDADGTPDAVWARTVAAVDEWHRRRADG